MLRWHSWILHCHGPCRDYSRQGKIIKITLPLCNIIQDSFCAGRIINTKGRAVAIQAGSSHVHSPELHRSPWPNTSLLLVAIYSYENPFTMMGSPGNMDQCSLSHAGKDTNDSWRWVFSCLENSYFQGICTHPFPIMVIFNLLCSLGNFTISTMQFG